MHVYIHDKLQPLKREKDSNCNHHTMMTSICYMNTCVWMNLSAQVLDNNKMYV